MQNAFTLHESSPLIILKPFPLVGKGSFVTEQLIVPRGSNVVYHKAILSCKQIGNRGRFIFNCFSNRRCLNVLDLLYHIE